MTTHPNEAIYIAGHRGEVGSTIVRWLQALGHSNLITGTHAELGLTNQGAQQTALLRQHGFHTAVARE